MVNVSSRQSEKAGFVDDEAIQTSRIDPRPCRDHRKARCRSAEYPEMIEKMLGTAISASVFTDDTGMAIPH